jgi:type IV secretion system protein TrbL
MASSCGSGVAGGICHIIPFIPIVGGWLDLGGAAAKNAVSDAGSDVLNSIAQAMASAANGLLNTLSSFWMHVDTPDMTSAGSPVAVIQANIGWITTCTAVVCILVAAGRMAIRRRGEPGTVLAMGLARLVIVSAVATFLVQAAGKLGDTFSADLMSSAHLGSTGWSGVISTTALAGAFAGGDGMLLVVALLVIFSSLIQLALMICGSG